MRSKLLALIWAIMTIGILLSEAANDSGRGRHKQLYAVRRAYLNNNSFTANVVDEIPHESRLESVEWGMAEVE